jgi:hypothetical protein
MCVLIPGELEDCAHASLEEELAVEPVDFILLL